MGRPSNVSVEAQHLKENKSYNDIIFHFCKIQLQLTFLSKEGKEQTILNVSNEDSQVMSRADEIMSIDNFPKFDEPRPTFLLHSNSIHFLMRHLLETERKDWYSSHEMNLIFKAFLRRRGLLTESVQEYMDEYWDSIIDLVNNPNGEEGMIHGEPNE